MSKTTKADTATGETEKFDLSTLPPMATSVIVPSFSDPKTNYTVTLLMCTCPDVQFRRRVCKHMLKAYEQLGEFAVNPFDPNAD